MSEENTQEKDKGQEYLCQITDEDKRAAKEANPNANLMLVEATLDDERVFEAIFKKPTTDSFQRFLSQSQNQKRDNAGAIAAIRYVQDNIIKPTGAEFYDIQKDLPALAIQLANELSDGMGLTVETKKKTL